MNRPDAPPARLRVQASDDPQALLRFGFGAGSLPLSLPCARLGGASAESWRAGEISESADTAQAAWAHGEHYAMVALSLADDDDIEQLAECAYRRLLTAVRPSAHPYLLRIWNYFADINRGELDEERYRRFCVGRARAVDEMFNAPPPAATAIGSDRGSALHVVALCARAPALAIENPRQTPAWQYPREHGPVAPGFSRGAVLDADTVQPRLLASGTASIVGHVSRHVGDLPAQLRESLLNLQELLAQAGARAACRFELARAEALRVYLRRPEDLAIAQALLGETGIAAERIVFLRGDICRRELDVELEGVFPAS